MEFIVFTLTAVLVKVRNSMATCWGSYTRIFSHRFKGVYFVRYKRKWQSLPIMKTFRVSDKVHE